jgi:hypothetical protein
MECSPLVDHHAGVLEKEVYDNTKQIPFMCVHVVKEDYQLKGSLTIVPSPWMLMLSQRQKQ